MEIQCDGACSTLREADIKEVLLWKLDVEGAEYEALVGAGDHCLTGDTTQTASAVKTSTRSEENLKINAASLSRSATDPSPAAPDGQRRDRR